MEIVRNDNQMVVKLTSDEVDRVVGGKTIGEREGYPPIVK